MRSRVLSLYSLLLSTLSIAHGCTPPPVNKKFHKRSVALDIPRGGGSPLPAGPFSVDVAQKTFLWTFGANAVVCALLPSFAISAYGIEADQATKVLMQGVGSVGMNTALLMYLQSVRGMSFEEAIGWSVFPFVINEIYQACFEKSDPIHKMPAKNRIPSVVLNLTVFVASQTKASWAGKLNMFYGFFSLLNAVPMYCFPDSAAKVWETPLKSKEARLMIANFGYFLLGHGVSVLVSGSRGAKDAIGWTALALSASLFGLLLKGEFEIVRQGPVYPWIVLLAAIANSLLSS